MKRLVLFAIWVLLPISLLSQVRQVTTNLYGDLAIYVEVSPNRYIVVDVYGDIIESNIPERMIERYTGYNRDRRGQIERVGDIRFEFYSDFWDYQAGKIESIGGVQFEYHSDFGDYEAGKIESIGGVRFKYHSDFWDYEAGKIESIGSHRYRYESGRGAMAGALKSGDLRFRASGIEFIVVARNPNRPPFQPSRPRNYRDRRGEDDYRSKSYEQRQNGHSKAYYDAHIKPHAEPHNRADKAHYEAHTKPHVEPHSKPHQH